MARLQILGGAYRQASLIAGAQRSRNLYPEMNAQQAQAPVGVTHYPRAGLTPLGAPPNPGQGRGLYVSSIGDLYAFVNQQIYYVNPDFQFSLIGNLLTTTTTPVSAADNGLNAIIVDGDLSAAQLNLLTKAITPVVDPNFLGATRADFLDYILIFNEPGTPNWYSTQILSTTFNALLFGTKTAWPDNIITLIANERQAWILGQYKSEIWTNAGTTPFSFQILSGNIIEYGIAGPYAVAKQDINIYWVSQSPEGARMALRGQLQGAQRISTNAIEEEWLTYPRVDDCILTTWQIRGHQFCEFHFPTADRTWVWDELTSEWHEKGWFDTNGTWHRSKDLFKAYAYGRNIGQDWSTGQIYLLDETNFTDNGVPIVFERGLPHLQDDHDFNRLTLWRVITDMEVGSASNLLCR